STIKDNIKNKSRQINRIQKQSLNDIRELRAIYVNQVISKIPPKALLSGSVDGLLDDANFQKVIDGQISYQQLVYDSAYRRYTISNDLPLEHNFQEIEK